MKGTILKLTVCAVRGVVLPRYVDIFALAPRHLTRIQRLSKPILGFVPLPVILAQEIVHELLVEAFGMHPGVRHDVEFAAGLGGILCGISAVEVADPVGVVGGDPGAWHEEVETAEEDGCYGCG